MSFCRFKYLIFAYLFHVYFDRFYFANLWARACQNKRIPLEGSLNSIDDRKGILPDGGDVAPDAAENICSLSAAKGS